MLKVSGELDRTYWEDRLEVPVDEVLAQHVSRNAMLTWVHRLSPRCREILVECLGLDGKLPLKDLRAAIMAKRDQLLPFLLVDAASRRRHACAILEVAQAKLSPHEVEACRRKKSFEHRALLWRLFLRDPANLELVFHLDRTHRKGFSRMVMRDGPPPIENVADRLKDANLQQILDAYEEENKTHRRSLCAQVLNGGDTHRVFVKRDGKPGFVSNGAQNTFGFKREWIVMEFDTNMRRLNLSSKSAKEPVALANRIASTVLGEETSYVKARDVSDPARVDLFLRELVESPSAPPIVELTSDECGLEGAPEIRLRSRDGTSLSSAIAHFTSACSNPLEPVRRIKSLKILMFGKRVQLSFEVTPSGPIVRYVDRPLTVSQRRDFERIMSEEYGLKVVSTEKRSA